MTFIKYILIIAICANISTSSSSYILTNININGFSYNLRNQISIKKSPTFIMHLNKINEYINENPQDDNTKKLLRIKENIQRYIEKKKYVENQRINNTFVSNKCIIKKVDFDKVVINIRNIQKIYFSSNNDRIIIELVNNTRNVYYIKDKNDLTKIEELINLIPNKIKIVIITDYERMMDDMYGPLYCEK